MFYEPSQLLPNDTSTAYWVCWSARQEYRYGDDSLIHLQRGEGDEKTLCGIETDGYWAFAIHWSLDSVRCKRCLAKAGNTVKPKPRGIVTEGTLIKAKRDTANALTGTVGIVNQLLPSANDNERFITVQWNYQSRDARAESFTRPGAIEFLEVIED